MRGVSIVVMEDNAVVVVLSLRSSEMVCGKQMLLPFSINRSPLWSPVLETNVVTVVLATLRERLFFVGFNSVSNTQTRALLFVSGSYAYIRHLIRCYIQHLWISRGIF